MNTEGKSVVIKRGRGNRKGRRMECDNWNSETKDNPWGLNLWLLVPKTSAPANWDKDQFLGQETKAAYISQRYNKRKVPASDTACRVISCVHGHFKYNFKPTFNNWYSFEMYYLTSITHAKRVICDIYKTTFPTLPMFRMNSYHSSDSTHSHRSENIWEVCIWNWYHSDWVLNWQSMFIANDKDFSVS